MAKDRLLFSYTKSLKSKWMGGQGSSIIRKAKGDDAFLSLPFFQVWGKVKEMSRGSAGDGFGFNDVKGLQRTCEKRKKENCIMLM